MQKHADSPQLSISTDTAAQTAVKSERRHILSDTVAAVGIHTGPFHSHWLTAAVALTSL